MDSYGSQAHALDRERVRRVRDELPPSDAAARMSMLLRLIAEPTRIRVLYALQLVDELCVGDLCLALDLGECKIGYALRLLRAAGMLTRRRAGRVVYYRLADNGPSLIRGPFLAGVLAMSSEGARASARAACR